MDERTADDAALVARMRRAGDTDDPVVTGTTAGLFGAGPRAEEAEQGERLADALADDEPRDDAPLAPSPADGAGERAAADIRCRR